MDAVGKTMVGLFGEQAGNVLAAVVRGGRNGITYGCKIRFPHALVMTFMFAEGSLESKVKKILELTHAHARNLCLFVTLYKALLVVQRTATGTRTPLHSAIAGAIGSSVVFGDDNPVNQQINLYLLSRITLGAVKLMADRGIIPAPEDGFLRRNGFRMFAMFVWAVVMWMFEKDHRVLQPSLRKSMTFLYWDSEKSSHWWP